MWLGEVSSGSVFGGGGGGGGRGQGRQEKCKANERNEKDCGGTFLYSSLKNDRGPGLGLRIQGFMFPCRGYGLRFRVYWAFK